MADLVNLGLSHDAREGYCQAAVAMIFSDWKITNLVTELIYHVRLQVYGNKIGSGWDSQFPYFSGNTIPVDARFETDDVYKPGHASGIRVNKLRFDPRDLRKAFCVPGCDLLSFR